MKTAFKTQSYANPDLPTREELEHDFKVSARTSISRRSASAPLKHLIAKGYLGTEGSVLNYGKGRCSMDTDALNNRGLQCTDYDFSYANVPEVLGYCFSYIWAAFVVNTLPLHSRNHVWQEIANSTGLHGEAFVAARSDADKGIKGTPYSDGLISSIGTFQKAYSKGELLEEALRVFDHAEEIKCPSGYRIVRCSHSPLALI
ncbi:hypothetical protein [Shewanella sp. MBTL60-007]|uniref:hypothetical protein n=1 Tax=Shewanella sp. MBTL60-007 TaxID=2815911 RepID=UPI001BC5ACBA|nr:hypothetical protein [Shewanella sp. MBTL60-007]GIU21007.1 hypothetical protein TUM3792_21390 [Shewanella sp. MBTL60-007]